MKEENIKSKEKVKEVRTSTKRRRKNKRKKILLGIIFILIIILLICYFLLTFQAFNIKDTIVIGCEKYSKEELVNKLDIHNGENIFKKIYYINKTDYSSLAYIEKLNATIASTNKLKLKIEERKSLYIAFNKENNKYYRLDKDGYILEECNPSTKNENEVLISGISFDHEVKIGTKITDVYIKKIDSYLNIKKEYENTELKNYGNITKVNFDNSLTTITINDKLNVILQDNRDLKYNISLLQGIIKKIPEESVGTIDMTKTNPVYSAY